MKRTVVALLIGVLMVTGIALVVSAEEYAFYYACTAHQDTGVVIMNTSGDTANYVLKVYDAYGKSIARTTNELAGYESDYHLLSDLVGSKDTNWGLAVVETTRIMSIGVDAIIDGVQRSSDNVSAPLLNGATQTYYWYSLNYANTSDEITGVAVVNPFDSPAAGTLYVYDAAGDQKNSTDFLLDPHESDYYSLSDLVSTEDTMWGVVDIKATVPIIVAGEYFNANGDLLNVDEITEFYYREHSE